MKGGIATHYFCDNKYKVLLSWENWDVWPLYLHKSFMIWTLPWFPDWFSIMLSYALSTIATLNCLHCPTDAMFSRMSKPLQKTQLKWQFSVILFSALRRSISPVGLCADSDHLRFFFNTPKEFLTYYKYIINYSVLRKIYFKKINYNPNWTQILHSGLNIKRENKITWHQIWLWILYL